jgi:hypothetical protein
MQSLECTENVTVLGEDVQHPDGNTTEENILERECKEVVAFHCHAVGSKQEKEPNFEPSPLDLDEFISSSSMKGPFFVFFDKDPQYDEEDEDCRKSEHCASWQNFDDESCTVDTSKDKQA